MNKRAPAERKEKDGARGREQASASEGERKERTVERWMP